MALSTPELKYLRTKVGDTPDDAVLQESYDRHGSLDAVAREILETRLANFQAQPAQFSVAGEYSQGTGENIKALENTLDEIGGQNPLGEGGVGGVARVVLPVPADDR